MRERTNENKTIAALLMVSMLSGLTACGSKEPSASDLTANRGRETDTETVSETEETNETEEEEETEKTGREGNREGRYKDSDRCCFWFQ